MEQTVPFPPRLLAALLDAGAPPAWVRGLLYAYPNEAAWRAAPPSPGELPAWREVVPVHPNDQKDVALVSVQDPRYPDRLRNHPAAPPLLFCKGDLSLLSPAPLFAVPGTATVFSNFLAPILASMLFDLKAPLLTSASAGSSSIAIDSALQAGGPLVVVFAGGFDATSARLDTLQNDLLATRALCISPTPPSGLLTVVARQSRDLLLAALAAPLVLAGETPLAHLAYELSAPILVPLPRGAHRLAPEHSLARALAASPAEAAPLLSAWNLSSSHLAAKSVANAVACSREDLAEMLRILWGFYKSR